MRELLATITKKGQVTIPAKVRRHLGIKRGDRVAFVMKGDQVWLVPGGNEVERTAGIFKSNRPPLTAKEEREQFEQGVAEEVAAEDQELPLKVEELRDVAEEAIATEIAEPVEE